jgi:hypothetical protein
MGVRIFSICLQLKRLSGHARILIRLITCFLLRPTSNQHAAHSVRYFVLMPKSSGGPQPPADALFAARGGQR